MKKIQYLGVVALLAGLIGSCGQAAPNGDAAKGKELFNQQCGLCHDPNTTDKKMGPGLKGLYKRPKLNTTGKPTNDANVAAKINEGGNGMPPFKEMLAPAELTNILAYLRTL